MAQIPSSQLFTLRVWPELTEDGQIRWRGKLRHIPSDTVHYFRDWAALVPLLLSKMESKNKPDTMIFVMAFLSLLSLGGVFGGLLVFTVIIPAILELGSFARSGAIVMFLLGILTLLVAVVALWAMIGLWQGKAIGRDLTLILTATIVLVAALSIPILLLVGLRGIALAVPLVTAVFLLVTGSGVLWALKRPFTLAIMIYLAEIADKSLETRAKTRIRRVSSDSGSR
jgi:hypothetical protein